MSHFAIHDYDHQVEGQMRIMQRVCLYDGIAPTSVAGVAPALVTGVAEAPADVTASPASAKSPAARL